MSIKEQTYLQQTVRRYKRMQTEREREAKKFRAQGTEIAQKIRSTADKDVTVILAQLIKNLRL